MHREIKFILFQILLLSIKSHGYMFSIAENTDNGYCEMENGVLVAVNDFIIDLEKCEIITCRPGEIRGTGCSDLRMRDLPGMECELVRGDGPYPNCCPHIPKCTEVMHPTTTEPSESPWSPSTLPSQEPSASSDYDHLFVAINSDFSNDELSE